MCIAKNGYIQKGAKNLFSVNFIKFSRKAMVGPERVSQKPVILRRLRDFCQNSFSKDKTSNTHKTFGRFEQICPFFEMFKTFKTLHKKFLSHCEVTIRMHCLR